MPPQNPARRYVAKAVPYAGRWRAQWAAPGLIPDYVMDGREPAVYATEEQAEFAALRILFDALNKRPNGTWKGQRELPAGHVIAAGMAKAGIGPTDLSRLIGSRLDRVLDMISGARPPPFHLWWTLPVLGQPGMAEWAIKEAMRHTDESRAEDGGED